VPLFSHVSTLHIQPILEPCSSTPILSSGYLWAPILNYT
jgi:hypothetical protein